MAQFRDVELAEDVLQEALLIALTSWPVKGVPERPAGWLLQTARHKAIDRLRREENRKSKEEQIYSDREGINFARDDEALQDREEIPDDLLRLIFMCCHPALGESARTALTLRHLGGLTVGEIARIYLVSESTMNQRLVRAKRKIKASGIPFRTPAREIWSSRLASVHATLYLIFTAGYAPAFGREPLQAPVCEDAIRLCRVLYQLMPEDPETGGLLALMLLHHSRNQARVSLKGDYIPLQDQDRSGWDTRMIEAGETLLKTVLSQGKPGPYQIQAAVSAVHAGAPNYADTDWQQIVLLYRELYKHRPSPIVRLNEIAARAATGDLEQALQEIRELQATQTDGELENYQPFFALRADLLRRAGYFREATTDYRQAIILTNNAAEKQFLKTRIQEMLRTNPTTRTS